MVSNGFPNVTTSGQQDNIGEKPSVILYLLSCMTCAVNFVFALTAPGVEWGWPGRREPDDEHSPAS